MSLSRALQLVLLIGLLYPTMSLAQPIQGHWLVGVWEGPAGRLIGVTSVLTTTTAGARDFELVAYSLK
jgi:hypothetical protein